MSGGGAEAPDYVVDNTIFEVGGISKGFSQFKSFKAKKKILLTHPGSIDALRRPLFFIGML